jgi:glycosyltransferase 2 family protein
VKTKRATWQTGLRVGVGVLLLVWIFHCIFVNEARTLARTPGQTTILTDTGEPVQWDALSRVEQWHYGWRYGPRALWATLSRVEVPAFGAALLLMGAMIYLGAVRWRLVLRIQGLELPLSHVLRLSLIAHFFNAFLLGTAGGDVAKAYYAAQETHHKKTEAVLTVFVDRIIGLWAMLLFGGLMVLPNYPLLLKPGLRTAVAFLLAMLGAATLFIVLAFWGGLSKAWSGARGWLRRLPKGDRLEQMLESCRVFGRHGGFLPQTLALSMAVNVLMVLQFLVLAHGLHQPISPLALGLVVPVVICIAALPISPSGLGVRENLFVYLLAASAIAVPATKALSLSLLAYAASVAWSLLGGLAYLTLKDRHHLKEMTQEE